MTFACIPCVVMAFLVEGAPEEIRFFSAVIALHRDVFPQLGADGSRPKDIDMARDVYNRLVPLLHHGGLDPLHIQQMQHALENNLSGGIPISCMYPLSFEL